MFKKLLSVGKSHAHAEKLVQQQQQKDLFQLNEIKSYGFAHHCCASYSQSLSLVAVGSKTGLLRVFGRPTVEFSYQLEPPASIRQIEFIDCKSAPSNNNTDSGRAKDKKKADQQQHPPSTSAKLVVLTDNGQLHLFELKTVKTLSSIDNSTQTDNSDIVANSCCQDSNNSNEKTANNTDTQQNELYGTPVYTKLDYVGQLDFFIFKLDDDDRSRRVTTYEISADGQTVYVGTEGGNLYLIPIDKFDPVNSSQKTTDQYDASSGVKRETGIRPIIEETKEDLEGSSVDKNQKSRIDKTNGFDDDDTTAINLNDEPHIERNDEIEPFEMVKFETDVSNQVGDEIKPKKQGAIESVKKHPSFSSKLLLSYHRGLSVIYNLDTKQVEKYFYHNQVLESSCFASTNNGDFFYTSHNDGSYIKWDARKGSQSEADDDSLGQLYGPYPCKPTPKIISCVGMVNDQAENLIIFSGGMPRATFDDKNPVTIVRSDQDGKDTIKVVFDLTSKVLDFFVITKARGQLGGKSNPTGTGGKKNKNKQQQQQLQQQRNQPIAVALAILAEEEFVVIDLLNSESYLEFPLPYLNCVQPSAITCNQHYSNISGQLYEQLLSFNQQHLNGKFSPNEWPITGGTVINAPDLKSHDILLTGHEDGSVNLWDVSDLAMRHLLHVPTAKYFSTEDDELAPLDGPTLDESNDDTTSTNPPLKRVGRFDPYSDDTRLAVRKISLCPQKGTLLIAGTGGQVLVFELGNASKDLDSLVADEVTIVSDNRFTWKGREKLTPRAGVHKQAAGYQLSSYLQLDPPAAATSTDLRSDWNLIAVGTSYGFVLYDYVNKHTVVNRCTLNVQDFAIVSGDAGAGAMSRKKSFRKSLRESFRRLRRGRSQRQQPATASATTATGSAPSDGGDVPKSAFSRGATTGVRTLNSAPLSSSSLADTAAQAAAAHRTLCSGERQVEFKNELSSIVKCITLTSAIITNNLALFKPSLWVGTNSGTVLVYAIDLAAPDQRRQQSSSNNLPPSANDQSNGSSSSATNATGTNDEPSSSSNSNAISATKTTARLTKEIQLKHKAPIIAIFTSPEPPLVSESQQQSRSDSASSTPEKHASELFSSAESSSASNERNKSPDNRNKSATESDNNQEAGQQRSQTPTTDKSPATAASSQAPTSASKASPSAKQDSHQQPRVLICSEEQFKVFNLPNLKPFCKFKLTAHEGLRAKKISITQFLKAPPAAAHHHHLSTAAGSSSTLLTSSKSLGQLANHSAFNSTSGKSSNSLTTQTPSSSSSSPVPPAAAAQNDSASSSENKADQRQANGAQQQQQQGNSNNNGGTNAAKNQQESNNNSLSALNNNSNNTINAKQDKEMLNAKFGVKTNSTSSTTTDKQVPLDQQQQQQQQQEHINSPEALLEPYMVCLSNQGDCAIYSVPDLKRQAQIQVCKREDVNGIMSAMLTNYGEGYYLRSSSNFLRFSISSQRVMRVQSVI